MHYMKWIYPRRLRNQMILMAILMVIVPTLTIGYIVETEGRSAVLSEKEKNFAGSSTCLIIGNIGNRYDLYIDLPREVPISARKMQNRSPLPKISLTPSLASALVITTKRWMR